MMLEARNVGLYSDPDPDKTAEFILTVQKQNGEIPWSVGGKTDPWDHVESAMGLTVAGHYENAALAYEWSMENQMKDGSWMHEYREGKPVPKAYKDTNMTAYIAVGILHYYLAVNDRRFLIRHFPMVEKALDFTCAMQGPDGEMYWAKRKDGSIDKVSLLTGSSSIYLSLLCGAKIADILDVKKPGWKTAANRLKNAVLNKPLLFDQTKSRFSMDWYYPILCGLIAGEDAKKRIKKYWDKFIIAGWGVRCVSDQPWLTTAETCELVMALYAMEDKETAKMIFAWITDKKYDDGAYYTGVTFPDRVIYTEEKTAWTAAAVLLAADMIYEITPSAGIFRPLTDPVGLIRAR